MVKHPVMQVSIFSVCVDRLVDISLGETNSVNSKKYFSSWIQDGRVDATVEFWQYWVTNKRLTCPL